MKSTVNQRIEYLLKESNTTLNQLSKNISIPQTTLSSAMNSGKDFKLSLLLAISRYFKVSIDWLAGEKNDIEMTDNTNTIKYYYNVDASMGGIEFIDNPNETYEIINIPIFNDCDFAINAFGDSMYPKIKSGQIILLKKWQESFIDYGRIYMIVTKTGYRMVKYIHKANNDNEIVCKSENSRYDDINVNKEDISSLFLVKGWICKETL